MRWVLPLCRMAGDGGLRIAGDPASLRDPASPKRPPSGDGGRESAEPPSRIVPPVVESRVPPCRIAGEEGVLERMTSDCDRPNPFLITSTFWQPPAHTPRCGVAVIVQSISFASR